MSAGLGEWKNALKLRDLIRSIAAREVERLRPLHKYGIVHQVSPDRTFAMVRIEGDPEPTKVAIGSIAPVTPAQVVRIGGTPADRFIDDVIGSAVIVGGGVEIGTMLLWPGATIPANCLACNGETFSTTTYIALFGVVQYRHGGQGNIFGVPTLVGPVTNTTWVIRAF